MNRRSLARRTQVVNCLVEGNSIRSTERMTDTHRDTIMRTAIGDQWTFVALDADSKLVPVYRVGKRTRETAVAFIADLSDRLSNRVQISSDSLRSYVDAVERAFVEHIAMETIADTVPAS